VITALALVAGSSVIFTDPIFQGMAISLSSGVLVSTILTLIVIPLGCVAASKDLCEVAVASAPPGMNVPCADDLGSEEVDRLAATASHKEGKLGAALAKIGGVLLMVLYAIRGIFLLLFDWIKGMLSKRKKRSVGGHSASGNGPAGPLPNALRRSEEAAPATPKADEKGPGAGKISQTTATAAATVKDEATPKVAETSDPAKAAAQRKKTTKKRSTTSNSSVARAAKPGQKTAAGAPKKASRRGIRLKTPDGEGGADR
jgi:hypothetical protein